MAAPILAISGLTKRFAGTLALDRVDFDLRRGEIHALLGQNGAGKSTLIKLLAGVYAPDAGEILLDGCPVVPGAQSLPIAFIHQDLGLVDAMTVAENVAIATGYPRRLGLIDWGAARAAAAAALARMASTVDPETRVGELAAAEKSLIAIARALAIDAAVLVLDEPTAALPAADVDRLLGALDRLRARGIAIIYVTHRLDEVARIADRITVLRDGRRVRTADATSVTQAALIEDIVGRALAAAEAPAALRGSTLLAIEGLRAAGVGPLSFRLARGEILALVGLRGAGHHTVGRVLFGAAPRLAGSILLDGVAPALGGPDSAMRQGIGFVSSKRGEEGLAASMSVRENLYLNPALTRRRPFSPLRPAAERQSAAVVVRRFSIRPPDVERPVGTLSGGNQQKAVLARWFEGQVRLLILEEPTIGVDVGSKAEIYALLGAALAEGMGVLLISSDFEEVALLAHRALVFNRGSLAGEIGRADLTQSRLTELAGGLAPATLAAAQ